MKKRMIISSNISKELFEAVDKVCFKIGLTRSEWLKRLIKKEIAKYIKENKKVE